jgi:opacity protein-like surface antigen
MRRSRFAAVLIAVLAIAPLAHAQDSTQRRPAAASDRRLGVDIFAGAGINFPGAQESFDALSLSSTPLDVGGGVRVTGLWGRLFAQVTGSRWSESGERAFVDSEGEVFPLGIPLDVDATFIDATIGVKDAFRTSSGRIQFFSYVGAGAGIARYKESSPFAEGEDDLDTTEPSYHVLAGVEIPIGRWLAVAIDGKYRYIPRVLGDGGVSDVLDENNLGGFQTFVGLRLGFGGPRYVAPPPPRTTPSAQPPEQLPPPTAIERLPEAVISEPAAVYLLPDTTRTPLRTLPPGTAVRILEEKGDWVRVEFTDPQFGRRVGYVQRKFVQKRKDP